MSEEISFYPINKILLPTDGSTFSIKAAKYAAKVAKKHNSKVTILHVMGLYFEADKPIEVDNLASAVIEIKQEKEIKNKAKNIVERTKKFLSEEHVPSNTEYFLFGNIPEIIIDTAEKENFDLIIMGYKGLSGFKHTIIGSVAEKVCRHAPLPSSNSTLIKMRMQIHIDHTVD